MKNKYISYFINSFAAIGFFVVACSVADSSPADSPGDNPDDNPPIVQSNIGKYQVAAFSDDNVESIVVLNTENGKLKSYYYQNSTWNPFKGNGDLTVSH